MDEVRTSHYRQAIVGNPIDFQGKVVMDVGAGSGILSLFVAQAGAAKVYAVEASSMADNARILVEANGYGSIIEVINSKIEDITEDMIPKGSIDVIVSEPLGTFLVNERMLETYVIARDRFLRPGGKMYPSSAHLCAVPFTDEPLYNE